MANGRSANIRVLIALGIIGLFGIITFALAAATLGTLNKRYNALEKQIADLDMKLSTVITTTTTMLTNGPVNATVTNMPTLPTNTTLSETTSDTSATTTNTFPITATKDSTEVSSS